MSDVCFHPRRVTPEWPRTRYGWAKCLDCGAVFRVVPGDERARPTHAVIAISSTGQSWRTDDAGGHTVRQRAVPLERLIARIVLAVSELPDRTSPEDQPDMMLVTADELEAIVERVWEETE